MNQTIINIWLKFILCFNISKIKYSYVSLVLLMSSNIDYKLLRALATVVQEQSFERASEKLYISQSAVSQRIKQLEQNLSQPVIIRSSPLRATEIGKRLISHYHQVTQLETDLLPEIFNEDLNKVITVHLATNADSLATWLIPAIAPIIKSKPIELNLLVSNEKTTIQKLKDGEVFGAIGTHNTPIKGCQMTELGTINYVLAASPEFSDRYFKKGISKQSLVGVPGVAFDHFDNMHTQFAQQQFGLSNEDYPLHTVRSSEAFITMVKNSTAYSFISELQIREELNSGALINIMPEYSIVDTLYWHRWTLLKGVYKEISERIIEHGQNVLN